MKITSKTIKEHLKKTILEAHYMGMDKKAVIDMLENIYLTNLGVI